MTTDTSTDDHPAALDETPVTYSVEPTAPAPEPDSGAGSQLSLALPGLEVTAVGIDTVGIPAATALDALRAIRPVGRAWRWSQGDLVLALCGHELTELHLAWTAIAGMDLDERASLMKSVLVAAAFPIERRRAALSWSHHDLVHQLDADDADEWLRLAEQERWTCHTLSERLRVAKESHRQEELPDIAPPKPWAKQHAPTIAALGKLFGEDPTAVVLVAADGTFVQLPGDDPRVRAAIETTGADR